MNNYNIVASTENEQSSIITMIRAAGAVLTGVSGYGSGYYIQLEATPAQVMQLNRRLKEARA